MIYTSLPERMFSQAGYFFSNPTSLPSQTVLKFGFLETCRDSIFTSVKIKNIYVRS